MINYITGGRENLKTALYKINLLAAWVEKYRFFYGFLMDTQREIKG